MSDIYQTIELDQDNRLVAYYEHDARHYTDITGDSLCVQPIAFCEDYGDNLSSKDKHQEAIARIVASFHYYNHERNYRELRERAVSLYLSLAGVPHKFVSLRGYNERADVVIYDDEAGDWITQPNSEFDLQAWFSGEVYNLTHQQRTVYTATDGRTLEDWDTIDSLGFCVFSTDYGMLEIARENFAIFTELPSEVLQNA